MVAVIIEGDGAFRRHGGLDLVIAVFGKMAHILRAEREPFVSGQTGIEFFFGHPGRCFPVHRKIVLLLIVLPAIGFEQAALTQRFKVDIKIGDGDLFLLAVAEQITRFHLGDALFKVLDDPHFKMMDAAMG